MCSWSIGTKLQQNAATVKQPSRAHRPRTDWMSPFDLVARMNHPRANPPAADTQYFAKLKKKMPAAAPKKEAMRQARRYRPRRVVEGGLGDGGWREGSTLFALVSSGYTRGEQWSHPPEAKDHDESEYHDSVPRGNSERCPKLSANAYDACSKTTYHLSFPPSIATGIPLKINTPPSTPYAGSITTWNGSQSSPSCHTVALAVELLFPSKAVLELFVTVALETAPLENEVELMARVRTSVVVYGEADWELVGEGVIREVMVVVMV